jgi:hypothetical protein
VKYFIPEWDDRVDPEYDFINDKLSKKHIENPANNDAYLWNIFGLNNVPIDGVLVSRVTIKQNKKKYEKALKEGIHKVLGLPKNFEIIGDCGAFGYVKDKFPPFDPIETLQYYRDLGFNYGVTVDHLVVPEFEKEKEVRMRITYENGVKSYYEWAKSFKEDYQLIAAVQGWEISDYIKMYRDYIELGITHIAFGGLARSPTTFIVNLIDKLIEEIKTSRKRPTYLHFFGLARFALFPKFQEIEDLGVKVGFDSASYLRKAWLSTPTSQLNYLTLNGNGYTAIRIPFVRKMRQETQKIIYEEKNPTEIFKLEHEALNQLRLYDKGEVDLKNVIFVLSKFTRAIGASPELIEFYKRTLEEKPWKSCDCPICKSIGIDVLIFRGNNRNRRRGFHNTYVFYKVLKNPKFWSKFINKERNREENLLVSLEKSGKILVITECTKEKLGYDSSVKTLAKQMYQGRLFKTVRKYCESMGFDYVIISAKYGLIHPDDIIEGYETILKTKEDVEKIRPKVEEKLRAMLDNYDKVVVIAGKQYREVLKNLWNERFIAINSKGYGDLCSRVSKALMKERQLLDFM